MIEVTCRAPVNIAVVKYWGKRDEELILPLNDSISLTLNSDQLCATTTAAHSSTFVKDRMWLNGIEQDISQNPRLSNCINHFKRHYLKRKTDSDKQIHHVHVVSENNFPTAAGLASSAAGYACLVYTLAKLYQMDANLSMMARLGSGSACRSIHGGFVHWEAGKNENGSDSVALQLQPADHWPELRVLILVVSDHKKKVASTIGMRRSVKTSDLLAFRANNIVSKHIDAMKESIDSKDFEKFANITMKESNQLHAICLDSSPPIFYLSESSKKIIHLVSQYNLFYKKSKVAYTFDAGPNATIFLLDEDVSEFVALLNKFFPSTTSSQLNEMKGDPVRATELSPELIKFLEMNDSPNTLQYIIHTKAGAGPQQISDDSSLINDKGLPKSVN